MRQIISCTLTGMLLCIFMCIPSNAVYAAKALTIAVNPNWPPMEMKDKKGKLSGYEIDLIKAIGEQSGFKVKLVQSAWKNIFKGLEAGKYDAVLASVSITESKKEKYDFSDPYFTTEQIFVVPKAKATETLREKTIAAFKLTTGAEAIRLYQKVSITFYTVEETDRAFKDLSLGYIDGILCDSPVAMDYANCNTKFKDKFAVTCGTMPQGIQIPKETYGIAVKKGNEKVLALINKGLQAVKEKGIEEKIRSKWIKTSLVMPLTEPPKPEEAKES